MIFENFFRYFVFGEIIIATSPIVNSAISEAQYSYAMEITFVENSSLNFYINFISQTAGVFFWRLIFYIIVLIFFVVLINMLSELKRVRNLCLMIGDAEDELYADETKKYQEDGTLSTEVLGELIKELDSQALKVQHHKYEEPRTS